MNCLFHKWNGCKCARCGVIRDRDHSWNGCTCRICGRRRNEGHDWNGCTCRICGKRREEGHDWNGCACRICGKQREDAHEWIWTAAEGTAGNEYCYQQCRYCRKTRSLTRHDYQPVPGECAQTCIRCGHQSDPVHTWTVVPGSCIPVCAVCGAKDTGNEKHRWKWIRGQLRCAVCDRINLKQFVYRATDDHEHIWEEIPGTRRNEEDGVRKTEYATYQCKCCGITEERTPADRDTDGHSGGSRTQKAVTEAHTHRWVEVPGSRVYEIDRSDFSCGTYRKRCAVCGVTVTDSFSHYPEDA